MIYNIIIYNIYNNINKKTKNKSFRIFLNDSNEDFKILFNQES